MKKKLERVKLDFFANASHELKSPLTSIIGYQQMIEEGIITDENEIKDATAKTIKEANRMNQIIIEMLELSKLEAKNDIKTKEVLSIKNTTLDILSSLIPNMHQKHISYKIIGDDFNVFIASTDLNHLIRNLIDNAIKYNKEKWSNYNRIKG
ncbi:MAG: HAMP domain-containing histidine kinase [Clostridium sp.]|nr:MAG: HAMP domain-containing histidine kinase [Clostridium sp.]